MTAPEFTAIDQRALRAVATQFFVNGAVLASFVPRLPEIRDRLDISIAVLGAILAAGGAFGIVGSAVCGRLIERFGTRTVIMSGGLALISMLPVIGFAQHPAVLFLALAGMSVFDVLVDVSMNLQASWLSDRRHTPVMNRLHGLWSLGTVIGGLVVTQVVSRGVSLEWHLSIAAMVLVAVLVFVGQGVLRIDEHAEDPAASAAGVSVLTKRMPLVLLGLAGAFALAVEITNGDWAAFRLADDFGTTASFAGLGFVAHTVGMTASRFSGDWLLTRLGSERLLRLSTVVSAIGLAGAALIPNRYVVIVCFALAGSGIAVLFPKLYDDAAKLPGRPGAGLGALTAGTRISGLVAPAIVGALAATSLSVGSAVALVTLPSIVGFVAVSVKRGRSFTAPPGRPQPLASDDR